MRFRIRNTSYLIQWTADDCILFVCVGQDISEDNSLELHQPTILVPQHHEEASASSPSHEDFIFALPANQFPLKVTLSSLFLFGYQCCGSGMFIPDPGFDFYSSRIQRQKQKRGEKKICCHRYLFIELFTQKIAIKL
jgi:hypothetical protein